MPQFVGELIILIIGGLGFMAYRHPREVRWVVGAILVIGVSVLALAKSNVIGRTSGLSKAAGLIVANGKPDDSYSKFSKTIDSEVAYYSGVGDQIDIYFYCLMAGFLVLISLSYLFEKIKNQTPQQNSSQSE